MSVNGMPLKNRLVVKQQWICDLCGEVIQSDKDGMLEWEKSYSMESGEFSSVQNNFRIVHGRWVDHCVDNRPDDNLADGHLHWYTGPDGLNKLLGKLTESGVDKDSLIEIIRRLHVDYYEEARTLLDYAEEDGYDLDEDGYIPEEDLKVFIRKFGNKTD